eukprot:TRINITY_DN28617_c0_g1_i2.p1 TRINITY_DN28617_c0_g1~~TRINITY_DN28617_c0_g1_i2.p1  ORF type:complete len:188 (-),score=39.21 TRINITY_DN28617_c0_g1_i2:301-864(-)
MLDSFPQAGMELAEKQAIDWVAAQVNDLSGEDIAARLSLNCSGEVVVDARRCLDQCRITLLESFGDTMVPEDVRRDLRHRYPHARLAQLKAGGDFPYLAFPEEVTLFLEVHLRGCDAFGQGRTSEEVGAALAAAQEQVDNESLSFSATQWEPSTVTWQDEPSIASSSAPAERSRSAWKNPFLDDPLL